MNDFGHRLINRFHRGLLAVTGGRIGSRFGSMPVVELHTIGRSSGERRSAMLTAPVREDGRYVLVASKGGDPRHPSWYVNLVANPDVELTVDGRTVPMRARTATPAERAELWPRITRAYPGYAGYQRKTTRQIPVVICEPR
ncbi:nitroreductase family deazaflavin-dependent oxidoreductase [uncultured Microbacterium sp.]|uniref:nitroreductase family deazaflavin-dependent oxidoreductase n=1 Tax=uncultured Microbacterium sp. TaxID=191216 RepID=UPI0028D1F8A7|nr:nitroreductase family deazaflavin-dependent oxidoreductase [uncultured Microbacterium sp.]